MARTLERSEWQTYFDRLSRVLEGRTVQIAVAGLDIGAHTEAAWLPLIGLVYDPKDDLVEVAAEGIDHLIRGPRTVVVDETGSQLVSIAVRDRDDVESIIEFRDPLMLPAPEGDRARSAGGQRTGLPHGG